MRVSDAEYREIVLNLEKQIRAANKVELLPHEWDFILYFMRGKVDRDCNESAVGRPINYYWRGDV